MTRSFVLKTFIGLAVAGLCGLHSTTHANDSKDSDPTKRFGGEIRVAINSDILSTNPGVLRDGNTDTVLYHIGESLVGFRNDLTVAPLLAETITLSEDRLTYQFTLRRDVKFHNGARLTATDVKWTWDRLLDPKTGFRCSEFYNGRGANGVKIEQIVVIDDYTITFHLNKPSALFLHRMADIQCQTPILHRSSVADDGTWRGPIATGPYKLGPWKRGYSVTLERFADYTSASGRRDGVVGEKIAYADRIIFVVAPDRLAAKSSVYAGNMDLVFAVPLSAHKEMERRIKQKGDIKTYHQDTLDWTVVLLQSTDPLLQNPLLRKAIAHAISPKLVTEISTFGLAQANTSAVQTTSPYHTAFHDHWIAYDPAKARAMAKEAGYRGERITIQANRKFPYMFDNAVAIQAMLNAAGFNVHIDVFDWATQLTNFFKGNFQLSSFGYAARSHPALLFANFTGDKTLRQSYQWDNPKALALIEQFENAFSDADMQDSLDQLYRLLQDDVPIIGLYNDHVIDLSKSTLHGYEPWAFGRPRLWGVWTEHRP